MPPRQEERNARLIARREEGAGYKALAYEFSLSKDRARRIYDDYGSGKQVYHGVVRPRLSSYSCEARAIVASCEKEFNVPDITAHSSGGRGGVAPLTLARRKAAFLLFSAGCSFRGIGHLLRCANPTAHKLKAQYSP
jgi:hypothetical protein